MSPNIYAVRATAGQEQVIARLLYQEALSREKKKENRSERVYSILYTTGLKGYVLVEADNPGIVEDLIRNVPKTKGLLLRKRGDIGSAGSISIDELEKILTPKPAVQEVSRGDLVELISGPFKKEKARVARIDKDKDEITVELIEAAVPIPITVKGDDIKIIRRESEEEEE
ncbi:MAG: transcription elongation factor Spt5 [Candidatus Altiarchaeales archaeon]|nr:MAG: transcription elongation factor Spt5 [Candidatus Altiarchaeales archaeon]RLI94881.1 MAG: transcription elongation factor Spt5 [Candidatus Altiarchaeales archaeon]RLI94979.1 MAG: transcription elongation factor Spt5 [Candidatus Altiarchaeales archaeon]HDO82733.1 transcription elongation factor Spt5 [Candidatus Altiarchaeales archaeon]HEX55382.1 transcription elongation factor Spt5 [Candidatus Altiarchaeales archaeon]